MNEAIAVTLERPADYEEWRCEARRLVAAEIAPERVGFRMAGATADLFGSPLGVSEPPPRPASPTMHVPRDFPKLAKTVLCHSDASRFALLYRLLWRLRHEPRLLDNAADPDVFAANRLAKAVRRDSHKMKAFVRFRRTHTDAGEVFVAWFEPDHHIVERTAPFFARRFTGMRWSIITPERSAHWDGETITYGDGASRRDCPDDDALEEHWRIYYSSIFNPARLKVKAMRAEMPAKYWRNLPEARLIPELTRSAEQAQRAAPAGLAPSQSTARRLVANQPGMQVVQEETVETLDAVATLLRQCTRCELCYMGTSAVPGEGPADAGLMIVGEQPGDSEDLAGRPFVGPAGAVLDEALQEVGIERSSVYLSNAVKHFKYTVRGKRRLHQRPNAQEIESCRWWLDIERELVKPRVILALGATAARAVFGNPVKIADVRGEPIIDRGSTAVVTVHPAYLLRLPNRAKANEERRQFIEDLRLARELA